MRRAAYEGPTILAMGFRPFFLAASLFGLVVVPIWWLVWRGDWTLASSFPSVDWHIHEMIFGYAAAVIAGFLFTAVPNWSGRMPTRGWPLLCLSLLWLAGRLALAGLLPLGPVGVALVDSSFLLAIGAMILFEIVAGKNWRNLKVVVPVGLLCAANILFHVEVINGGESVIARRLGLALVLFLITLIGGRIIPSFTRNWLAKRRASRMPVPFGRFDAWVIALGAVGLLTWVALPQSPVSGGLLGLGGLAHLARLSRWRGAAVWRSPLLLMLHVAYGFLAVGLLLLGAAAFDWLPLAAGMHMLGIGAMGGMTVAVMIRATLGHTGRGLIAGPTLTLAFGLICAAAITRAALPELAIAGLDGIAIAALLWTLGFAILAGHLVPWLALPAPGRKRPSRARPS
ncbi:NnrS family protein [Pseudooceanicola sp.]|uniref:NnrS family protein n=1 Tax=Pseudooceanicola sp. TaxID=1914328 RepID=UPI002626BFA0|nr:NnrS family protein [Pseudooceanicola sp.]MDF1856046.1 NnrS family protein [Pseudooceanicola sp.]